MVLTTHVILYGRPFYQFFGCANPSLAQSVIQGHLFLNSCNSYLPPLCFAYLYLSLILSLCSVLKCVFLSIFETLLPYKIRIIHIYPIGLLSGIIGQIVIQYIALLTKKILVMVMMMMISAPSSLLDWKYPKSRFVCFSRYWLSQISSSTFSICFESNWLLFLRNSLYLASMTLYFFTHRSLTAHLSFHRFLYSSLSFVF